MLKFAMFRIESVTAGSPPYLLEQARALFRAYGEFLHLSGGEALLCFSQLEQEILNLPSAYADRGGELLLATADNLAAGCIAYRSLGSSLHPDYCEIKRLFVDSPFRGQRLGKRLVSEVLHRARMNGYRMACLDTEPGSMAAARQMYLDLGFVEDEERKSKAEGNVVSFFKKQLNQLSGPDA